MPLTKTVFFKVPYSLSEKEVSDLDGIYEYTILNFWLEQARAYLLGLHEHFRILADTPGIRRSAAQLAPELRCHEYRSTSSTPLRRQAF